MLILATLYGILVRPQRMNQTITLELSYQIKTWHDDFCYRKVQFRKCSDFQILTKSPNVHFQQSILIPKTICHIEINETTLKSSLRTYVFPY